MLFERTVEPSHIPAVDLHEWGGVGSNPSPLPDTPSWRCWVLLHEGIPFECDTGWLEAPETTTYLPLSVLKPAKAEADVDVMGGNGSCRWELTLPVRHMRSSLSWARLNMGGHSRRSWGWRLALYFSALNNFPASSVRSTSSIRRYKLSCNLLCVRNTINRQICLWAINNRVVYLGSQPVENRILVLGSRSKVRSLLVAWNNRRQGFGACWSNVTKGSAMLAEAWEGFIYNLLMEQAAIGQSNFNRVRQVR
jgi:hypothetical protein